MTLPNANPSGELEGRLRFETLIADLSSKFINLPPGEVDRAIEEAQRRVCECLGLDLSALWQWASGSSRYFTMTHLYRPLGGPPPPERIDAEEMFPWSLRQLLAGKIVSVATTKALPPEAARDQEVWHYYGIKSVLVFPLATGGESPLGAMAFHTVREERAWPDEMVNRLMLVAQVFANALARKAADQALRASEERLSLAADSAGAGLWELDCATNLFWATPRALTIFGFGPDEAVSLARFEASVHPEDRPRVMKAIQRALKEQDLIDVEYRILAGTCGLKWIASRGRPFFTPAGAPARLVGVSIDATERKRTEQTLRELSGRLIVAHEDERRRIARELHDDFSQRLALLSVEMELLQASSEDAERPLASRLGDIANRVKELSSEVHRMAYELHPAKLDQLGLTAAARSFCHELSQQAGMRIHFEPGTLPRETPAEVALCLYRILQESLHNVVRHSGAPEAWVELRAERGRICLVIRDAGLGFEFERGRREGGLGLSSMQERVRLLSGVINVTSAPGRGTRVEVCVPLTQQGLAG